MDLGEIRISATQDSRESSEEGSSNIIDLDSTGGLRRTSSLKILAAKRMFPSHSTCAERIGNGRSTFISALRLPRRPRRDFIIIFEMKINPLT